MRITRNATQIDNPNNPELVLEENDRYWLVTEPEDRSKYRLNPESESRVGQVGKEIETGIFPFGYGRQTRLQFADGAQRWYYQAWLRRVWLERRGLMANEGNGIFVAYCRKCDREIAARLDGHLSDLDMLDIIDWVRRGDTVRYVTYGSVHIGHCLCREGKG